MKYKYIFTDGSIEVARYSFDLYSACTCTCTCTEYVCWVGHEEIGYYKHCQWILAGGHLTMKIYPAYPGQPLVSSQLFAAPLTQLSLAPHQALWLRVQLRTTLSVFT